jgi:hypothetical protein
MRIATPEIQRKALPWEYNPGLHHFLAGRYPSLLQEVENYPWELVHAEIITSPPRESIAGKPYLSVALVGASLSALVDGTPPLTPGLDVLRRGREWVLGRAWSRLVRHIENERSRRNTGGSRFGWVV